MLSPRKAFVRELAELSDELELEDGAPKSAAQAALDELEDADSVAARAKAALDGEVALTAEARARACLRARVQAT